MILGTIAMLITHKLNRVFSSVGLERYLDRVEVTGSNPVTPTRPPVISGGFFISSTNYIRIIWLLTGVLRVDLIPQNCLPILLRSNPLSVSILEWKSIWNEKSSPALGLLSKTTINKQTKELEVEQKWLFIAIVRCPCCPHNANLTHNHL